MDSGRTPLPVGTRIKLEFGSQYRIIGSPIGFGGCSILYPAHRILGQEGQEYTDGAVYALKECFPAHTSFSFCRDASGAVVPETPVDHARKHLEQVQDNMMKESKVVTKVFAIAHHILPVLEAAENITITLPNQPPCTYKNTFIVMHSLQEKGTPLHTLMADHHRFKPVYAIRILQQLLFALKEIHSAGFLHLDIKDSNIFLRGALDEADQILTLMDLGSAKPLQENGRTGPIALEDLFFSGTNQPPEASVAGRQLLRPMDNPLSPQTTETENTVCFGAEADLYQAGCLLRYLLTGKPEDSIDLLYRPKGHCLSSRQIKKMECPERTAELIIRLLDKALDPDPSARYASAVEMLEDVTRILDKLSSKPATLESAKYDAFICYKHGPIDSIVARKLQQMLEHYRMPAEKHAFRMVFRRVFADNGERSIPTDTDGKHSHVPKKITHLADLTQKFFRLLRQEHLRRKPFHRVFVDEGELSSCADMGGEIDHALKNSAHLIVLCSEDTPNSVWVEKEIEAFRKHHKYDQNARILTVLTGGKPETSYPAALISEGRSPEDQYSPQVQSRYAWKIIYDLRRGQILRLIAPMLGNVNLEDLLQRNKIYQRRRTAVAAVCLSIVAAISISRSVLIARQIARIEEEHAAAQYNASLYLTEQARLQLEDKNRIGALELLLEALPTQEQEFAPAPQTEYQLAQALGAYISPHRSAGIYTDTGKIQPSYTDFFLDSSGDYLFSWNAAGETIDIWNAGTMTPHCTVNIPLATVEQYLQQTVDFSALTFLLTPREYVCETSVDFLLPDTSTLIYRSRGEVSGLDYITGEYRWIVPMDRAVTMAINESRTHLLVLSEAETDHTALTAHILKAENGQTLRSLPLHIDPGWNVSAGMQISDDLKWAAVPVQEANPESVYFPHQKLYLFHLETGEKKLIQLKEGQIASIKFVKDKLFLQHHDNFTFTMIGTNGSEISKVPDSKVSLTAYDPVSGSLIWQQELFYYCWDSYSHGILPVSYDTGAGSGQGVLFYWERFAILTDMETGEILRSYELPDGILEMKVRDNSWCATLCDGSEAMSSYDSDNLYRNKLVSDPLTGGCSRDRRFFLQHKDGSIVRYEENCFDETYENHGSLEAGSWQLYDACSRKDGCRLLLTEDNQAAILDTGDQSVLYYSLPHFSPQNVLGLSDNRQFLYWNSTQSACVVWSLNLRSGATKEYALPLTDREISWWDPVWLDGQIVYATMSFAEGKQNELTIYSWNPQKLTPKKLYRKYLPGETDAIQWSTFLGDPDSNACILAISEVDRLRPGHLLRLDIRSQDVTEIPLDFLSEIQNEDPESAVLRTGAWQNSGFCWSSNGDLAVISFGDTAYCVNRLGDVQCRIPLKHAVVASRICPDGESLFLAEADGTISRWRLPDGLWMGSISLAEYCAAETLVSSRFRWHFQTDGDLAVYTGNEALLLDFSGTAPAVRACVKDAQLLDENDQFWILENPQNERLIHIGTFRRYSAEDLQKAALKELQ